VNFTTPAHADGVAEAVNRRDGADPHIVRIVQPTIVAAPTSANQRADLTGAAPRTGPQFAMVDGSRAQLESSNPVLLPAAASTDPAYAQLARHMKDYPRDTAAYLEYELLQFAHDQQVPELNVLAPLPAEDRELIAATMDGLTNLRNGLRSDGNMLFSRKVKPLLEMAERLRSQAELTIPTLTLCTKVEGFGVYDPIEPPRFTANVDHPVIIYSEVENFSSQLGEKKMWETRLRQQATLFTENGLPVWEDKSKAIVDVSRNRRHDFFVVKLVHLPPTLSVGRYLLKVTIVDEQLSRVAEATLPVEIVAQ
jgi:hypothetical protein